ncbi:6258_t:CDS:2 [Acaulospora morrowiae]|uniref:6258_t:CDS:1 n=1 Tax=Acaulospora morrowiae TaxID=94023 RepID=A0A9N9HNN0_9GLOM|nr:6258_t:CDS:2 [Acaulospora morrowiae]
MSTEIYEKVYNFLTTSPMEHITAVSFIYQVIKVEPWISKEESRTIVQNAINSSLNIYSQSTLTQNKLLKILVQHPISPLVRDIILGRVEDVNLYSYANFNVVYIDTKQSLLCYDDAFKGVRSLRDIGAVKTNKEKPLSSEQIEKTYQS